MVKVEGPHGAGGHTCRFHIVEQGGPVVTHVAFSCDPFFEIKPRNLEGAGLEAISASDAFTLIDDYRPRGQLGDGLDRTDPGTRWPYSVMACPVLVCLPGTVPGVDAEIDHDPVVGREIYLSIRGQLIPFNFQFIPPLAGGHATLATDAPARVNEFAVPLCLRTRNAG